MTLPFSCNGVCVYLDMVFICSPILVEIDTTLRANTHTNGNHLYHITRNDGRILIICICRTSINQPGSNNFLKNGVKFEAEIVANSDRWCLQSPQGVSNNINCHFTLSHGEQETDLIEFKLAFFVAINYSLHSCPQLMRRTAATIFIHTSAVAASWESYE